MSVKLLPIQHLTSIPYYAQVATLLLSRACSPTAGSPYQLINQSRSSKRCLQAQSINEPILVQNPEKQRQLLIAAKFGIICWCLHVHPYLFNVSREGLEQYLSKLPCIQGCYCSCVVSAHNDAEIRHGALGKVRS